MLGEPSGLRRSPRITNYELRITFSRKNRRVPEEALVVLRLVISLDQGSEQLADPGSEFEAAAAAGACEEASFPDPAKQKVFVVSAGVHTALHRAQLRILDSESTVCHVENRVGVIF